MRNTTPTPPGRVHTPPAPRLGAMEDEWTPFTPRRSSRVAAAQRAKVSGSRFPNSTTVPGSRTASQLSPPSSPRLFQSAHNNPEFTPLRNRKSKAPQSSIRSRKRQQHSPLESSDEGEMDSNLTPDLFLNPGIADPKGVLPTPSKTPRKKEIQNKDLGSTGRVLFHPRLANVEDAMPSPKKRSRKSLGAASSSLASVLFDGKNGGQSEKIEVYEDSRERIPTADHGEDNPFLVRADETKKTSVRRGHSQRDAKMEEEMKNDQGVTYVFRGKKFFKRFANGGEEAEEEIEVDTLSDLEIKHQAGEATSSRLSRSSLKPRILWPSEEQLLAKEAAKEAEAAEEALTDIEAPEVQELGSGQASTSFKENDASVPTQAQNGVPKHSDQKIAEPSSIPTINEPELASNAESSLLASQSAQVKTPIINPVASSTTTGVNKILQKTKRGRSSSPFEKWGHTKRGSESSKMFEGTSAKREGSPMEQPAKRIRNDVEPVEPTEALA